ncbi:hypothetical protein GCM10027589_28030 [Actinocorallia lasiicapitis]
MTSGRKPARKKGRGAQPVMFFGAAAGLVLVLGVALVLLLVLRGGGDGSAAVDKVAMGRPAETGLAPETYSSSPSSDVFASISTRAKDKAPLTIEELFGDRTLMDESAETALARRATQLDKDCATAMWGVGLGDVLREGGCNQAGRALYADTRKGLAVTIAVFNLADSAAADETVKAFGNGSASGFVRPLTGQGALAKFGQGFSVGRGVAMGHYAVITWAQRTDGTGDVRSKAVLSLALTAASADAIYARAAV